MPVAISYCYAVVVAGKILKRISHYGKELVMIPVYY